MRRFSSPNGPFLAPPVHRYSLPVQPNLFRAGRTAFSGLHYCAFLLASPLRWLPFVAGKLPTSPENKEPNSSAARVGLSGFVPVAGSLLLHRNEPFILRPSSHNSRNRQTEILTFFARGRESLSLVHHVWKELSGSLAALAFYEKR